MNGESFEKLAVGWQRVVALVFAIAVMAAPVLAFAQGGGGGGGTGGGGTGGGTGSGSPGGAPPAGTTDGGGRGFAWVVVLLAIAVAIWLFTRRRTGQVRR
jgi:hypothetical protein